MMKHLFVLLLAGLLLMSCSNENQQSVLNKNSLESETESQTLEVISDVSESITLSIEPSIDESSTNEPSTSQNHLSASGEFIISGGISWQIPSFNP